MNRGVEGDGVGNGIGFGKTAMKHVESLGEQASFATRTEGGVQDHLRSTRACGPDFVKTVQKVCINREIKFQHGKRRGRRTKSMHV